jgi:predicted RecB family nuclease
MVYLSDRSDCKAGRNYCILRKVERPSRLGNWSYEVYDTNLARETKATTILQLAFYSELLGALQDVYAEWMWVVPPGSDFAGEAYRVAEYAACHRYVKAQLEKARENGNTAATAARAATDYV